MGAVLPTRRIARGRYAARGMALSQRAEAGQLRYDNFNGRWGSQEFLDQFLQAYAVERAKSLARQKGHSVIEQKLDNGSIKLTVNVGGAA